MDAYKEFVSCITGSEGYYLGSYLVPDDPSTTLEEAAKAHNRNFRHFIAQRFTYGCTFDSVLKTYARSGFASSWIDKSYGITWVAVHSIDDSICVVTRHHDLDMARVGQFYKTAQKSDGMYALTEAIVSEVEGLPYDDDFRERSGLIIKKPFGVVSVFPAAKESNEEETGQLASSVQYDEEKAINFLREKMKSESVITLDDAIKAAISAFKHLCLQELEAEEYWVTAFKGHGFAEHLLVPKIKKHLADVNSGSSNGDSGIGGSTNNKIEEHFPVPNIIGSDGKKGGAAHVATPHPSKQARKTPATDPNQKTPKSGGGSHVCKSCTRSFGSEVGLQSHTKAKHSAGK